MSGKKKKRRTAALLPALTVMMIIFGLGIMMYPGLADWYNRVHASETISDYNRIAEAQSREEKERIKKEAEEFNSYLAKITMENGGTINAGLLSDEQNEAYENALAIGKEGLMGYLKIPSRGIRLPIYHGTGEKALQAGAGHLEGSSLPVGGASTHCVLTGHTGLPSARLFTDIDKMENGETFQLIINGETLTYQVVAINVVLPMDSDSLRIEEGKDLCTLLTCTPYGINSHRLLVTGERIPTPEEASGTEDETDYEQSPERFRFVPILIGSAAAGILIGLWIRRREKKKEKAAKRRETQKNAKGEHKT